MSIAVEALFTGALGLQAPWSATKVELDTSKRRIDFEAVRATKKLPCPARGVNGEGVHDRIRHDW